MWGKKYESNAVKGWRNHKISIYSGKCEKKQCNFMNKMTRNEKKGYNDEGN